MGRLVISKRRLYVFIFLLSAKTLYTLFAIFVFARFTPLIDAQNYLAGSYGEQTVLRTRLIGVTAFTLSNAGGDVFANWCFGMFSLVGVLYYLAKGKGTYLAWLPMLLPSAGIWTSIVGKEAIYYGAYTLLLVIWARLVVKETDLLDNILFFIAMMLCMILRPHYTTSIVWLYLSGYLSRKMGRNALWLLLPFVIGVCVMLNSDIWQDLLSRGFGGIDPSARASRFVMLGVEQGTMAGFNTFKSYVPLGTIISILGPLPKEVMFRPIITPFFIEGLLILIFPLAVYVIAQNLPLKNKGQFMVNYWVSIFPMVILLMILHSPFGILNPGSAIRWRVNFEASFHIAPLLLLAMFLKKSNNENNSLSS